MVDIIEYSIEMSKKKHLYFTNTEDKKILKEKENFNLIISQECT